MTPSRPLSPAKRPGRSFAPKFLKPTNSHCTGCPLESRGAGFVPTCGSPQAPILLVGESPWIDEMIAGEPFTGAAGSMLTRVLRLIGRQREQYRIGNIVSCLVPDMKIDAWPGAVTQCRYLDDAIDAHLPKVVVPMGGAALRRLLNLPKSKHVRVEDFHGTVQRDPTDRFWVVPSYHPSHLQRGATNLMSVVAFDLQRAQEVSDRGWAPDPGQLYLDPPVEWFRAWADQAIAAIHQDPYAYPLAVDIETPEKGSDEAELAAAELTDASYRIKRINLSVHPDEGITVPDDPAYLAIVAEVLAAGGVQYYWYKGYDVPRLVAASLLPQTALPRCYDVMWMAKALQSDLPMGLGFWAPLYSRWGAWKHLSESRPVEYAATDALQTRRVGDGCVTDLVSEGRWEVFQRHMHDFHRLVLQPATDIGVPIDRGRLTEFKGKLDVEAGRLLDEIAELVPPELCPRTPKDGLHRPPTSTEHVHARVTNLDGTAKLDPPDPLKQALYARATVVESLVLREVLICKTCGKLEVSRTHRCATPLLAGQIVPELAKDIATVTRWFWQEPFNPDSPQQLLAYAIAKGHPPGKDKHSGNPSMDRATLAQLAHDTGDPLYAKVMDYRAVGKVRGTYAVGTERRLDDQDRVHPTFTFKPSTMRLSCVNPNIQNVVADKDGKESLAAGFRLTVVAKRESVIMEFDFAGIEAVILGWCMQDPAYIRLGTLGVHAYLASHVLKRPADLSWSDADLRGYFGEIKHATDPAIQRIYKSSKKVVHGNGYGQTPDGVFLNNRSLFATKRDAQALFDTFYAITPTLPTFHAAVRHTAHVHRQLGGPPPYVYTPTAVQWDAPRVSGHPYAYLHKFHSVVAYERLSESQRLWRAKRKMPMNEINGIWWGVKLGEDGNRCVAFYPQSIARGVLTEACFPLFDPDDDANLYIGDAYYGETPLRAPIHDSLLLEVPTRKVDQVTERVLAAMGRPVAALPCPVAWGIGDYLTIGVDGKIGPDWGTMRSITPHTEVASDVEANPVEIEDADDMAELTTLVRSA